MKYKLFKHQEDATKFILQKNGSGALFCEIGTGKTILALNIFEKLKEKEPHLKMLVLCPISLINAAWACDISKATDFKYYSLRGAGIPEDADIYILNYESYSLERYQILINELGIDMIVLDESSKIRNPKAKITKTLLHNKSNFRYRICMSGTPAPNSPEEYWSQMKFCSPALPDSFYRFRNLYMKLDRNGYEPGYVHPTKLGEMFRKGFKYVLRDEKAFFKEIEPYCFWAKKKDCLDLPEMMDIIREVTLSTAQMKVYRDMKRHMVAEIGKDLVVANVALAKLMKLRQITSGFAMNIQGEATNISDNAKLNELMDVLDELGDKQVIIWVQFHREVEMITARLKSYATLYSLTDDRDKSISDFKKGKVQYLIAHPKSASFGLTFVNCDVMIFFSIDYSYESIIQCKGRFHRPGQTNKTTCIFLLAKNTLDYDIKECVDKKHTMQDLCKKIISSQ